MTDESPVPSSRHPMAVYTALRLLIFIVPFLILWAVGVDIVWALLVSALLSSVLSIFLLSKHRDRMSVSITERSERMRQRMAEREASEDEWDDAQRDDSGGPSEATS